MITDMQDHAVWAEIMALGVAIFERFQKLLFTDEFRNLWNTTVDQY